MVRISHKVLQQGTTVQKIFLLEEPIWMDPCLVTEVNIPVYVIISSSDKLTPDPVTLFYVISFQSQTRSIKSLSDK